MGRVDSLLELQRTIGNRATGHLLQREEGTRSTTFLTLELERAGVLKGESKAAGHEGSIEVLSLDLGQKRPVGGGASATRQEKKDTLDITFTRAADSATPRLMKAFAEGDPVKSAVFEAAKADDKGKFVPYMTQAFKDGYLTNFSTSGGQGDVEAVEQIALEAKKA